MQHYHLTIKANKRPETLERLLRVIRHRGFELLTLNSQVQGNEIRLALTVQSTRAIELLKHQLVKLPDVLELN
ncbi:acetolactate synthase 2 small subunit [Glaesserella sp.]|uniref:acetolactate synthase 2 small subunit n=1 Tax=Glaesserella sp. TaxID=2094731 RepID=UPI0035A180D8